MKLRRILTTLLLLLSLHAFAAKEQSIDITVNGQKRNMICYTPNTMKQNLPLLIVTHGMNQNPEYQRDNDNWSTLVDSEGFVLCYLRSDGNTWDIGGQKDLDFVRQSVTEMYNKFKINKNRVYWTGFSMGTMLLYHGIENGLGSIFAAFAPCSGIKFGSPWQNTKEPVSIIHCHSKHDDVFPIDQYQPRDYAAHFATDVDKCKTYKKTEGYMPPGGWDNGDKEVWTDGLKGSEVEIFMCNGGGHWPTRNYIREIWAFFMRHSKVEGPKVETVYPEDGSFDMTAEDNRQFSLTLTKASVLSKVAASLTHNTTTLKLKAEQNDKTLLLNIPETTKSLVKGDWTLTVSGLESEDGGIGQQFQATYRYGVEEVGEEISIDTLYQADWLSLRETIGEGIPKGWRCKLTDSSDKVTTKKHTDSIPSGKTSHLVYYDPEGNDFQAGFQFYPYKDKKVELFTYDTSSRAFLKSGKVIISFSAVYLNSRSRTNKFPLALTLTNPSDNSTVFEATDIQPKSYTKSGVLVNSNRIELTASIAKAGRYNLSISAEHAPASTNISDCIIISEPLITTAPSPADVYKGGFLRTLRQAQAQAEATSDDPTLTEARDALLALILQYEGFTSVQPSDYTAATQALQAAMAPILAVGIHSLPTATTTDCYDLQGRRVDNSQFTIHNSQLKPGIYIKAGRKVMVK